MDPEKPKSTCSAPNGDGRWKHSTGSLSSTSREHPHPWRSTPSQVGEPPRQLWPSPRPPIHFSIPWMSTGAHASRRCHSCHGGGKVTCVFKQTHKSPGSWSLTLGTARQLLSACRKGRAGWRCHPVSPHPCTSCPAPSSAVVTSAGSTRASPLGPCRPSTNPVVSVSAAG